MLRMKRLRSVAQSTAHHSVSGLCYIHPHLGEACKKSALGRAEINLLPEAPKSHFEESSPRIAGGAKGLREQFLKILRSEGMSREDVSEASALFFFDQRMWPRGCRLRVVSATGGVIEVTVDEFGNPAEILT